MKKLIVWGMMVLMFLGKGRVYAATYFVSPSGSDSNTGTESAPWKTIQKSANTMVAGDTVKIHAGVYNEQVKPANSGTASQYITYANYGDGEVIIDGQGGARSNCIEVTGKGYLQFLNLHLRNAGYSDLNSGFTAFAGSHHLILDGLITEKSRFGIMLKGNKTSSETQANTVSYVTIKNSTVRNNAAYGIFVYYKVTDTVIGPNNIIYNENSTNGVPNDDQYGIDIDTDYPGDPANGARRITVIGNEVYGNRIQGIRPWNAQYLLIKDNYTHHNGATGIQVEDGCQYVIVEGNRSENNAQGYEYETGIWVDSTVHGIVQNNRLKGNQIGLMVTDSKDVLVRNNFIYENNRAYSGSNIMGTVLSTGTTTVTLVHNSLWRNGVSDSRGNLSYCSKTVVDGLLKNNIFSESAGENDGWINCAVTSDYNTFYNTKTLSMYYGGGNKSWSAYVSASGQDNHSKTVDPLFAGANSGNFTLQSNSPAINSGDYLARTTAAGSGTEVAVTSTRYFTDGYGLVAGDMIRVGVNTVRVTAVNEGGKTITVDRSISWNNGDGVSYDFSGSMPDMGASEYGGSSPTSGAITTTPTTAIPTPTTKVNPTPTTAIPTPTKATATPTIKPTVTPTTTVGAVVGDANGDGKVDLVDFSIWRREYLTRKGTRADFNKDGKVDLADYSIWKMAYLRSGGR